MHLNPTVFMAVTLTLASTLHAQWSIDELYTTPSLIGTAPSDPAWSPDGTKLAFLWNSQGGDVKDVFVVEIGDSSTGPAQWTQSESSITAVTWQPDGSGVLFERSGELFTMQPGGAETNLGTGSGAQYGARGALAFVRDGDLWVSDAAGERRLVGDERTEVRVASYRFSPDGDRIALHEIDERRVPLRGIANLLAPELEVVPVRRPFPGEEPRSSRLGVVRVAGGSVQWLDLNAPPTDPIFSYRWSQHGTLLVDRSDVYVKSRRILSVDAGSGRVTEMAREDEPMNVSAYWQAEWGPDGRSVYFLSDREHDYHIWRVTAPGGEATPITSGEFAVERFTVTKDAIFYVANAPRPEERQLFRVGLDGGEPVQWTKLAGTHAPLLSPDGTRAADLVSSDAMPPELFVVSAADETRITHSPLPGFYERSWAGAQYVTFDAHDGASLHGRLMLPPDFDERGKYPVIVGSIYANTVRNQWGGRNAHPLWGLDQHLLQKGYVLFVVDIRGSWGHGRDFRRGIRLDYGGIDVEDIHSGVKYLETLGYADMNRIGIWGSSYGGLLTCMSLFKKPGVYRAGVAGAPATNVFHATTGEMRVMMAPQDEPDAYERSSAFSFADGLRDRLLIIHGMRDPIVLYRDSLALVERLMELGKNVDLVTLPDSGHAWDKEDLYQTRFAFKKLVEYFDRHVKGVEP